MGDFLEAVRIPSHQAMTSMYFLALAGAAPIIIFTVVLPVWAGWCHGLSLSKAADVILFGLDLNGLFILGIAIACSYWKFAGLVCATVTWSGHKLATLLFGVAWLVALGGSIAIVKLAAPAIFRLGWPDETVLLFLAFAWVGLDAVASILPAALLQPDAWKLWRPNIVPVTTINPTNTTGVTVASRAQSPAPFASGDIGEALMQKLAVLEGLSASQALQHGVILNADGTLALSQGTLARLLQVSKGTINRHLRTLATQNRIALTTTASETRIQIIRVTPDTLCETVD